MQARHQTYHLECGQAKIRVSSDFDSGNLEQATVLTNKLVLTPALDPMHPQYSLKPSSKTFFHFKIVSDTSLTVDVVIERMKILDYFHTDDNFQEMYRICLGKKHKRSWQYLIAYEKVKPKSMRRVEVQGNFELHFELDLKQQEEVYLAYHFPYPFEKAQQFLREVKERISNLNSHHSRNIYFTNQLLIQSLERRPVNLLTLTDADVGRSDEQEARISKSLFPSFQIEGRPKRYHKPYVFLTCRVHSGETSSSYALEGVINFLLSQSKESNLLLKNFVFLIIPVLNPDGVFHGTYRMDTVGHNLNRFYSTAQSHKQPSIFAVQTLVNHYGSRIVFFMDFHSHPHPNKGSFVYGNSMSSIEEQTETQLFAKILSLESQCFGYQTSSFSSNQMNSRDLNQILTKDGSARVQLYKILSIPFAYTMQLGYHGCPVKYKPQHSIFSGEYRRDDKIFTINDYQEHGKSIMVTLLKMFVLSSLKSSKSAEMRAFQQFREQICKDLIEKEERFRQMDSFVFKKVKIINDTIYQLYYQEFFKKYPFVQTSLKTVETKDHLFKLIPIQDEASEIGKRRISLPQKNELSLRLNGLAKTIETSPERGFPIRSFKSTIDSRRQSPYNSDIDGVKTRQQSFRLAKQLNLNFNPFPELQRKKIYNLIGNKRSNLKKSVMNEFQFNSNQLFDIDTIDVSSQLQMAEGSFSQEEKDVLRSFRLNCFSPNPAKDNEEDTQPYNDTGLEHYYEANNFALPKIPNKSERKERQFNVQAQLNKQYDRKYNIREVKHLSPLHVKNTLRANSLRMRTLVKSMK